MIFVHGDVSGKSHEQVVTAGSYLGSEGMWQTAVDKWAAILVDAGNLEYFHATDFFNARGLWDSDRWRRKRECDGKMIPGGPEHDEFAERFCAVAADSGLVGFSFGFETAPFKRHLAPHFRVEERKGAKAEDARTFAVVQSIRQVGDFLDKAHKTPLDAGRGQIVFEYEEGCGKWRDIFHSSRKRQERWTFWFGSLTTHEGELIPLQIADLLAHEAHRRIYNKIAGDVKPLRKSFERMIAAGTLELKTADEAALMRDAEVFADTLKRFPDGLVRPTED